MVLQRNVPQPTDILSNSQGDLLNNNNAIDDSFGRNHYAASDTTANNGKHQVIENPVQAAHPLAPTDCIFYGMNDHATIGPLQYTRKPINQVSTPITCLQSSAAGINLGAGGTTDILDFTGIPYCFGEARACCNGPGGTWVSFFWDGAILRATANQYATGGASIFISTSGAILRITAVVAVTGISWTLRFDRILTP